MKDCRGELLERVRRGLPSAQERTAFEAHLDSCESCRMTLAVMNDFDAVGEAEPGDWERVAAMARASVAAVGRSTPLPTRLTRRTWRLAFAALALTGIAAAGVAVHISQMPVSQTSPVDSSDAGLVNGSRMSAPAVSPSSGEKQPSPSSAPTGAKESSPENETPRAVPTRDIPHTGAEQKPVTSEKDMYRAANAARREGRTQEAISTYQKLQRQFPRSAEAHASRVSLGGLLLKTGSSSAALAQFDAYLASGGGQLAAEALFGQAQAQRALGRTAEEAQNLDRLVRTYPQSAYATHAERRLRELR